MDCLTMKSRLFYIAFLMSFTYTAAGILCKNNSGCGAGSFCCGSVAGTQWCCSNGQICCTEASGYCRSYSKHVNPSHNVHNHLLKILSFQLLNNFIDSTDLDPTDNQNFNLKSVNSQNVESELINNQNVNHKRCDKDGIFFCGDKETCCKVAKSWMCCPYENGTCCKDEKHCCPAKTTCDSTKSAGCTDNANKLELAVQDIVDLRYDILCPDHKRICLDTSTCCLVTNVTYGCCPYQDAVCCEDFEHCCPPDTVCHPALGMCVDSGVIARKAFRIL